MKASHIIIGTASSLILYAFGVYSEHEFSLLRRIGILSPTPSVGENVAAIRKDVETLLKGQQATQKDVQRACELVTDVKNVQANQGASDEANGQVLKDIQGRQVEALSKVQSAIDLSGENEQRRSAMEGKIAQVEQQIRDLLGRGQAAQKAAQTAYKLAQDAEKKGDIGAAERYVLNAINHDATNIEYYRYLASLTQKIDDVDELDRLQGMLELAYYRTDASNVKTLDGLIKAVEDRKSSVIESAQKREADSSGGGGVEGENREEATRIVENCDVLHQGAKKVFERAEENIKEILTDNADTALPIVVTALQNANGFISGRMAVDLSLLNEDERAGVEADLKDDIKTLGQLQTKLGEARKSMAAALYNKEKQYNEWDSVSWDSREKAYLAAMKYEGFDYETRRARVATSIPMPDLPLGRKLGPITKGIVERNRLMQKLTFLISYADGPNEELKNAESQLREEIKRTSLESTKKYQTWVVAQCEDAWKDIVKHSHQWDNVEKFDSDDAKEVIRKYLLEIDPALLRPETSDLYYGVLRHCKNELEGNDLAWADKALATAAKKKMEEF